MSRSKPYTVIGIRRKKCDRCGQPAQHQWSICSDGNKFSAICMACDILLNDLVLKFMRRKDRKTLMARYRRRWT